MKIFIEEDYELMSCRAADEVMHIAEPIKNPVLCTATGDSPKGLYKEMIDRIGKKNIDVSGWYFVGLDEWLGMNGKDEGSCRFHLNNDLLNPLRVRENRICFFDGSAKNIENEIQKTDDFIKAQGGIDMIIVGLGMNGHIGMNEPGTDSSLHSHISEIDIITQKTGQKYFAKQQNLSHGITLGIASVMEARNVILLANGYKKAEIIQKVLEGEISEKIPASLLRKHKNFSIYLDKEAAGLLQKRR